jgi:hypothetical protein
VTRKLLITASASEAGHELPKIVDRQGLKLQLHGTKAVIDRVEVTLDQRRFSIEKELFWQRSDQSRSMLTPFYVVRQPRAGQSKDDTFYVRVDGRQPPLAALTQTVGGV